MDDQSINRPVVLVVSGDPLRGQRRCAELGLADCRTIYVDNFKDMLGAFRGASIDLALLVLPLKEFPAVDLLKVLRETQLFTYLPIVVQMDRPDEEVKCLYFKHGADGVITAATSTDELAVRVGALIRVKELHDQLAASRLALQNSLDRERRLRAKLKRENAGLQELCTTDPLTRTQNVRALRNILEHEFKVAVRYNQPLSLLMLDLDHFKLVNDQYGHPSGDYVLKEVAVILKRSARESDVVARTGGEEFCVVLPRADLRRAGVLASRIRREVAAHLFEVYGRTIRITLSIGLASYPADAEIVEPEMAVYLADQALLLAKETGRDRVVAFHTLDPAVKSQLRRQYLLVQADQKHAQGERPKHLLKQH